MTISTENIVAQPTIAPNPLKRSLGTGFAVAAGVGTIIGLGILRTPGEIAAVFYNPLTYVGLWLLVGFFVWINTLVAAELVAMTPRSGGYYVLVKRALGPYPGLDRLAELPGQHFTEVCGHGGIYRSAHPFP